MDAKVHVYLGVRLQHHPRVCVYVCVCVYIYTLAPFLNTIPALDPVKVGDAMKSADGSGPFTAFTGVVSFPCGVPTPGFVTGLAAAGASALPSEPFDFFAAGSCVDAGRLAPPFAATSSSSSSPSSAASPPTASASSSSSSSPSLSSSDTLMPSGRSSSYALPAYPLRCSSASPLT